MLRLPTCTFFFILFIQIQGRRFCAWGIEGSTANHLMPVQPIKPNLRSQPYKHQEDNKEENIEKMLHKNDYFRSYHPHYLHSYSYPEPISPHIYFGQSNGTDSYVFLVKNNETLSHSEVAGQIFYVNSQKQEGNKNFLFPPNNFLKNLFTSNPYQGNLQFAMIVQIENMLNQTINTSITVDHRGNFLGIICQLYKNYYKSFVVYISENGKRAVNLSELPQGIHLQFKDSTLFNNQLSWKNVHQSQLTNTPKINLQSGNKQNFNTFIMIIKYNSVEAANKFKVAVREFPYREKLTANEEQFEDEKKVNEELKSLHQIQQQMSIINVNNLEYKFQVKKEESEDTCQVKAQKQLFKGLSYEYGSLLLKNGSSPLKNSPKELYSFTPSRKRFPWGFLWDDGFHCQVAVRSEPQTALRVIKSWLDTMLDFGWIPREQNRGAQRQFLCSCPNFMAKEIKDGNPPTLLLAINFLARQKVLKKQNFPQKYWSKLKKWYKWYFDTQMTEPGSYIFKWHDSIPGEGSFNSGMDDFPRMGDSYGHVDCQSWMYFFATSMINISQSLSFSSIEFQIDATKIKERFKQNFIQPNTNLSNDYAIKNNKKVYSPHFGYPSILPIALGLVVENSQVFNATMRKIQAELDSGSGLTSISKNDKQYLINSDAYWKGPVWININFLFLRGLKLYYPAETSYYSKLRKDLIKIVCLEQEERGYFFQNYIKGKGSFSYPFTGWTALISIIIRQNY